LPFYQGDYHAWCKKESFESMLADDASKRKKAVTLSRQNTLDGHLHEAPLIERVIPYSDALFRDAAIEWLVTTDQVLSSLYHIYIVDV
jgi:hypothetical protein